ncbi:amino acid polyamine transporter I [Emericellopsis cladophorae]|uniref:Amino acid polyamine transporter I n=1 Tax=Emericellopsis cladophorae TaxID=2686198 RepID=A0A9Q0BEJ6_9HYPO|nr:amino acid polyamine transporter I [Emericellopsis cladophorae]KAI6782512.1 amino acid polyamine transporter I [Emericellopsis cladophorae]
MAKSDELHSDGPPKTFGATTTAHHVSTATDRDQQDYDQLARLGKRSVLKRNFSFLTILGFSCAILVTWEGTLMNFAPGLANGGPGGLIYGFIFVWIGNLSVFSTLCELVSIAPTSGGQYHWVSMLAPRSCSKFLSYMTGWLTLAGWQGTSAAAGFLTGTMTQGLVTFLVPSYNAQTWQGTLMLWLCIFIAVIINTVVSSMLPKLEGMILVLHILGFFGVMITLVTFGANGDAADVFLTFRNEGMWPSQGLSWFVGLLGCVFSFVGVDCSFHMCEEVQNPSIAVPRSIMTSICINGAMGLAMIISMLYGATDIDAAINSPTGYPFIEIFHQATGSRAGTAAMTSLIIVMTLSAIVGVIAATSRMFWAFARDRALPFSSTLSKVDARTNVPVWAIAITSVISCLIGLINIGSAVVYNAIISVAVSGLYSSYLITGALLLYRRCGRGFKMPDPSVLPALADTAAGEGQELAWGPWHIPGVLGIVNNAFACCFMVIVWFFSFWPPQTPVAPDSMNYASLMTGGVALFSVVYYFFWAKREYKGPVMEVQEH